VWEVGAGDLGLSVVVPIEQRAGAQQLLADAGAEQVDVLVIGCGRC
jgi:hypothetical protein